MIGQERSALRVRTEVTVRDGRIGADPARVTGEGGEVLATFTADRPFMIGELVTLEDGTHVQVIGHELVILPDGWRQTVHAGEAFFTDDE